MTSRSIQGRRMHGVLRLLALVLWLTGLMQMPPAGAADKPILSHWMTLSGARMSPRTMPQPMLGALRKPDPIGYVAWLAPAAVAARGNFIFVADAARRQIFRYDLGQQTMTVLADYPSGNITGIDVASDLSLYVADSGVRQIMHFSWDGRVLPPIGQGADIEQAVAVVVDDIKGRVLVADAMGNRVLNFNRLGYLQSAFEPLQARSIAAMAQGPDGVYLVDRLSRQVVVTGLDGSDRYTFGEGRLRDPAAIAVDRFNRVFVSDSFDNTIKVFQHGDQIGSFGGTGPAQAQFNRITSLWLEQNMLYVSDSVNARIQIFRIEPPAEKKANP